MILGERKSKCVCSLVSVEFEVIMNFYVPNKTAWKYVKTKKRTKKTYETEIGGKNQ